MSIETLKQIWPEWSIGKRIGSGAYGTVYEATRNEYGVDNHAAIKIISIPASEAEIDTLRSEGLDMQATRTHFQTILNDFVNEIRLMVSLEGRPNIVNVKDYKVVEKKCEFGWYIFILMELLTPFAVYTCDHQMTEAEVIKLGCDICTALETCAKEKIIHRDIKPGNILVHKSGDFKLGDFGIARKLENMTGGLSQRYTPKYMAPEVATSMYYDERVDIYSLGIVLYELLNGRRIPFQPNKQINSLADIENAVRRRNSGEKLPAPCDASPAMANLILRACAYDPDMRFSSATEMKQALMSVASGTYQMAASNLDRTTSVRRAPTNYDKTTSVRKAPAASNQKHAPAVNTFGFQPKKRSKLPAVLSIVLILVLLAGVSAFFAKSYLDKRAEIDTIIEEAHVLADAADFAGAITKIEDGLDEYPDEGKLQKKLDEYQVSLTNQQIAAIIAEADSLASNGDYEGAIELVEEGLSDHPNNFSLVDKLTEYNTVLAAQVKAQTLTDAQALADAGDYKSAMSTIEAAQEVYGEDKDYDTAYRAYHKSYSMIEAEACVEGGDYPNAIKLILKAQEVNANDVELIAVYNTYCDDFEKQAIDIADSKIAEKDFGGAVTVLKEAQTAIPDSKAIAVKLEEVENKKPVPISTLTLIDSEEWSINEGEPVDIFGNLHESEYTCVLYNSNAMFGTTGTSNYAEYRSYGEYSTLTGTVSPYQYIEGAIFRIYLDDVLVESYEIEKKTDPIHFEIDISNADYIRFDIGLSYRSGVILSDVLLWKE